MQLTRLAPVLLVLTVSALSAGCRDWRLVDRDVAALSIEGNLGTEIVSVGEPVLNESVLDDDYAYLELEQADLTGHVIVRVEADGGLDALGDSEASATPRIEVERVLIDGERTVSLAVEVAVEVLDIRIAEVEYEDTTKTDVYVYRLTARWPDSQDQVEIVLEVSRDYERPEPADDDDWDDDDWDDDDGWGAWDDYDC